MVMPIQTAMAMIANAQTALFQHGFPAGAWGPCGSGIDGRYGADTRAAFAAFAAAAGIPFTEMPTDAVLTALEAGPLYSSEFSDAIQSWNQWRAAHKSTATYEADANAILCEATGVCGGERCPDFTVPPPGIANGEAPPPGTGTTGKNGLPWWFWGILGAAAVGIAGYVGYQVYKDYKGKRRVRGGRAPVLAGGYDITPVEMGEGEGYEGYGKPESDDEPDTGTVDDAGEGSEGYS